MPRPKRTTPKPRLTLQIEPEDQIELEKIARSVGLYIPSGKDAGLGSISALVTAIARQKKLKLVKNMSAINIDGNPTCIYFDGGILNFSGGDRLASREEYENANRCVGSIFEALSPHENIHLQDGYFILDDDLDLVQDWQII